MRISLKDRSKTLHNLHEGLLELAGSETEMKIKEVQKFCSIIFCINSVLLISRLTRNATIMKISIIVEIQVELFNKCH